MFIIVTMPDGRPRLINMDYISVISLGAQSIGFKVGTEGLLSVRFASENFAKDAFEMIVHAAERGGERVVIDLTGHQ